MNRGGTFLERILKMVVGAAFVVIGGWMMFLGVTFLPGVGIWLGLLVMGMAYPFFSRGPDGKREEESPVPCRAYFARGGTPEAA
jgi:hypothetical protein